MRDLLRHRAFPTPLPTVGLHLFVNGRLIGLGGEADIRLALTEEFKDDPALAASIGDGPMPMREGMWEMAGFCIRIVAKPKL